MLVSTHRGAGPTRFLLPVLAAVPALVAYLVTLSPSISWAQGVSDSGELAAAAYVLGVAHPTGYPLYMMLGWAFSHLPLGEPAHALNLFSALCGAVAAGMVTSLTQLMAVSDSRSQRLPLVAFCGAVAGGLIFAVEPAFWLQATNTETRTLAAVLVGAVLLVLLRFLGMQSPTYLLAAWTIEGVALADHLLSLAMMPALAVAIAMYRPQLLPAYTKSRRAVSRTRLTLWASLALLPGLALYVYLPWRASASPALDWGDPRTPLRFWWMVTGTQYHSMMGVVPTEVVGALAARAQLLAVDMGPLVLLAGACGFTLLCWRNSRAAALLGLTALTGFVQSSFYGADAAPDYLIPCEMVIAACAGYLGFAILTTYSRQQAARSVRSALVRFTVVLFTLAVILSGLTWELAHQRAAAAQAGSRAARDYGLATLRSMPRHAVIFAVGDDQTFSLWYAQWALGIRTDVAVVNIDLLDWQWYADVVHAHYAWLRWGGALGHDADSDLLEPAGYNEHAASREAALVRANASRVSIFWMVPDTTGAASCVLVAQGNLYHCAPRSQTAHGA